MATKAIARIGVAFELLSGRTVCLHEGDIVKGLEYRDGDDIRTLNGSIRVIHATAKNVATKSSCPPESYIESLLNVTSIIVDSSSQFDAELTQISISSIVEIAEILENGGAIKVGVGSQYVSLVDAVNAAPNGAIIELMNGEYTEDLTITKSIKLFSNSGAIMKGKIDVNAPLTRSAEVPEIAVELDGLFMTGNSTVKLENVDKFVMKNCISKEHELEGNGRLILVNTSTKHPVKVNIDNNVFGVENKCYNIIEVSGSLKNDSTFNNNVFEKGACTNNCISIYNAEEGAQIFIDNNNCHESRNMVRVGFMGDTTCSVSMEGNTYKETLNDYPGLFLVQPYGKSTTNMSNVVLNVKDTTKPTGLIGYYYAGSGDAQLAEDQKPKFYLDGALTVLTDLSPAAK